MLFFFLLFCILFLFTLRSISSSCYARELCWCMRIRHIQQLLNKNGERFGLFLFAHSHMHVCVFVCGCLFVICLLYTRLQRMRIYLFHHIEHWTYFLLLCMHAYAYAYVCMYVWVVLWLSTFVVISIKVHTPTHINYVGTLNALSWQFVAFRCYGILATHIHVIYVYCLLWSIAKRFKSSRRRSQMEVSVSMNRFTTVNLNI